MTSRSPEPRPRTLVIGIGNDLASDDGAGLHVVGLLEASHGTGLREGVRLLKLGLIDVDIIEILRGAREAWIVDACLLGHPPGTILEFSLDALPPHYKSPVSSHGLSLADIIRMGNVLFPDEMPGTLSFILIEGGSFEISAGGLSPAVRRSADEVAGKLARKLGHSPV